MKQKLISLLLSLSPLFCFSQEFVVNGIKYALYTNYEPSFASVIYNGGNYSGNIVIPEEVEYNGRTYIVGSIGNYAFASCKDLISIFIPKSISGIGTFAFSFCTNLSIIEVDRENNYLDSRDNCNAIIRTENDQLIAGCKGTIIPNSIKEIYYGAFCGSGIEEITIPESVTYIYDQAFTYCKKLRKIVVSEGNQFMDSRNNCNAIIATETNTLLYGCNETIIPDNIKIGSNAFLGSGIKTLTIPASVISLSAGSFQDCDQLEIIRVDESNPVYDSRDNCNAIINKELQTLVLGCKNTSIPESVKTIGQSAFYGRADLETIIISANIQNIQNNAFYGCNLKRVFVQTAQTLSGGFSENTLNHAILYVPVGKRWDFIYSNEKSYGYNSDYSMWSPNSWYKFIHIQEVATSTEEINTQRAYTLMNTEGYGFYVYDSYKNDISVIDDYYNVDQADPNNCWQVVPINGGKRLYNIGAKKFASISNEGKLSLTNNPIPFNLRNNSKGITIGESEKDQWNLVINDIVSVDNGVTSIVNIDNNDQGKSELYSINGQRINTLHKGLTIEHLSNGKTRKRLIK